MPSHNWVVIDTNIVLDLWVFSDPRTEALRGALRAGQLKWIATNAMREELQRVLGYAHINERMQATVLNACSPLQQFDALVQITEQAPRALYKCKDPDDQKFIDLAVMHQALLLSKDKCVLRMKNRLNRLNVVVLPRLG